jgi:elongation factor 1 alpha-like protein
MSRHQYVRSLDVHDAMEEFEGYSEEEEDELSPEDRALMNQGTIDVQAALGVEASKVTIAQIEEALWHYYYDVDKSVAYLTAKFINPPPKAAKPVARQTNGKSAADTLGPAARGLSDELDICSDWARERLDTTDNGTPGSAKSRSIPGSSLPARHCSCMPFRETPIACFRGSRNLTSWFFRDMPWGNIPKHREAILIPPPIPRVGLLGGSGAPPKMSKLQALAAARKKKAEEKSAAQDKVEQTRNKMTQLSVDEPSAAKESSPLAGAFSKRLKTSVSTAQGRIPLVASEPTRLEPSQRLAEEHSAEEKPVQESDEPAVDKAQQSAFAQTLFGSRSDALNRARQESYSLYASLPSSVVDAFSQPSPDDVVLAAQAKGSLLGKSKC